MQQEREREWGALRSFDYSRSQPFNLIHMIVPAGNPKLVTAYRKTVNGRDIVRDLEKIEYESY